MIPKSRGKVTAIIIIGLISLGLGYPKAKVSFSNASSMRGAGVSIVGTLSSGAGASSLTTHLPSVAVFIPSTAFLRHFFGTHASRYTVVAMAPM